MRSSAEKCSVVQLGAMLFCNVVQYFVLWCIVVQYNIAEFGGNMLQCSAVLCSVVHCKAVWCNIVLFGAV